MVVLKDTTQTKRHLHEAFGNRKYVKQSVFTNRTTLVNPLTALANKKTKTSGKPLQGRRLQTVSSHLLRAIRSIIVLFLYQHHIRARGEQQKELKTPVYRARRWVCERTPSPWTASHVSSSAGKRKWTTTPPFSTWLVLIWFGKIAHKYVWDRIRPCLGPGRGVAQAAEGFAQRVQLADDPHHLVGQHGRLLLAVKPGQQGDDFVAEGFQVPGLLVFGRPLPPAAAG